MDGEISPSEHLSQMFSSRLPRRGAEEAVDEVVGQVAELAHLQIHKSDLHGVFGAGCVCVVLSEHRGVRSGEQEDSGSEGAEGGGSIIGLINDLGTLETMVLNRVTHTCMIKHKRSHEHHEHFYLIAILRNFSFLVL